MKDYKAVISRKLLGRISEAGEGRKASVSHTSDDQVQDVEDIVVSPRSNFTPSWHASVSSMDSNRTWNRPYYPLIKAGLVDIHNSRSSQRVTVKGVKTAFFDRHVAYLLTCDKLTSACIGGVEYACLTLLFTFLFYIGGDECTNNEDMNLTEAFFLSIQSISTVGYGGVYATSFYCNLVVLSQTWIAILVLAFFTSLLFINLIRPETGIVVFSDVAVVNGLHHNVKQNKPPGLNFQLVKLTTSPVCGATINCVLWDYTSWPDVARSELILLQPQIEWLDYGVTGVHVIDENSPFRDIANYARKYGSLPNGFHIMMTVNGSTPSTGAVVTRSFCYNNSNMKVSHEFVPMITNFDSDEMFVDLHKLNSTMPEMEMDGIRSKQLAQSRWRLVKKKITSGMFRTLTGTNVGMEMDQDDHPYSRSGSQSRSLPISALSAAVSASSENLGNYIDAMLENRHQGHQGPNTARIFRSL